MSIQSYVFESRKFKVNLFEASLDWEKKMDIYRNLGGDSGVVAYEIESDSIKVKFRDGWIYIYSHGSAGPGNIDHMKRLAHAGKGLNGFIACVVRKAYASKSR